VRDQSEIESHSSSCPLVSSSSPSLSQQQQRQQQEQEHELHWQQKQGEQRRGSECSAGVVRTEEIPASRDQSPVTMNHVQQQQRQSATSVQKTTVNRLFLNLKEGFSLSSSSKNKNNNSTSSKNNNTNIREGGGGSGSGNRSSRLGSPAGALMIPKSAPSTPVTPTCVREPAPPATPSDELTNWFTRKLNFFSSSSHAYVFSLFLFVQPFV